MISPSKFEKLKASGHLPSPNGVALQVIQLIGKHDVTNHEISHAIKSDPALSGRVIKVANARVAYQTRPIVSIVDAVSVLGFNTVKQLVLGLSLMEDNLNGPCHKFDYQNFWAHSLLTAIAAKNMVLQSGISSAEEIFILGLLGQIGSLALATAHPQEYERILGSVATTVDADLIMLEHAELGFDHNQLTQAMMADWEMPKVFQEVVLHHENPTQSTFVENSRNWRLMNVLHIADLFSRVCLSQDQHRRRMVPKLILIASRLGVEMDALAQLGDKSLHEWQEWSKLCGIRSVVLPPFAELLAAVPLVPSMLDVVEKLPNGAGTFYKLRILLVDDDRAIQLLVKNLLEIAGHTVITADNGVEGLSLIEKIKPQLIITDWMMPEMDGIEFCKALRQNTAWRNIYMFIMTAQEGMERLVEAFEAGANDYLTKPVNAKVLVARLRAAQRVVQLQEELEQDRQHLHKFSDELAGFNHRLRKSDVSMRAILENSPYMSWLKDTEGRYIRINKRSVDYFQRQNIQDVIGKTDFELFPKEVAEKFRAAEVEVISSRQQKRIEELMLDGDKSYWLETYKTPVIDDNGKVLGTTGFARDITERKRNEADLRIAATVFESQEGMAVTDASGVILRVNKAFTKITGYTSQEAVGQTPRLLKSGCHNKDFYAAMWKIIQRTESWQGEIWNRRKNGEVYPEHLSITAVRGNAGKITHYVSTLHDITERKQVEMALRESENRLRTIIETEPECVKVVDRKGMLLEMNPAGLAMLEAETLEEAQQKRLLDYVNEEFRSGFMVLHQKVMNGESGTFEFRITGLKGTVRYLETHAAPMRNSGGEVISLLGITRDITESKKLAIVLNQTKVIFENSPSGMVAIDPESGRFTQANSCELKLLGYSNDEIQNLTVSDITFPEDREVSRQHYEQLSYGMIDKIDYEKRYVRKDGSIFWAGVTVSALKDDNGKIIQYIGNALDITDRKEAETKLKKEHEKVNALLNSMAEGAYGVDTNGNCTFVNNSFLRILGYEHASDVIGKPIHALIHHSHPDGTPYPATECRMYNAYRQHQNIHVFDEVFWSKNGMAVPVEYWSEPVIINNVVQGAIATFVDITQRLQAESEIKRSLSLLQATLESTADAILVVDQSNVWRLYNQQFIDLWNIPDEIIAAKDEQTALSFVISQLEDADGFLSKVKELYCTPKAHSFDALKFKDGRIIERFSMPQYLDGNVVGRVWSFRDVTERKQMEEQVYQLAFYDALTKLPNRRLLNDRLSQVISSSKRTGLYSALMFLDLDNFKPLNDKHGHVVGDLLLIEVAKRLKNCVRAADTVARFGGDEFVVMLNELDADKVESSSQAKVVAEKIRITLAEPYLLNVEVDGKDNIQVEHHCTTSVGVIVFVNHNGNQDDIMKWADSAMYQAKDAGRNSIRFYEAHS